MTTSGSRRKAAETAAALTRDEELALASPEERRALIARYAAEDEIEEDPAFAERTRDELAALRAEKELVSMLGTRSFDTLPAAVRKLYRSNPNNPSIKALYDATLRELYERTDDMMRGALLPAVERMLDLVDSDDEAIALRAATYVFERLRGKTPDVVEHRQDAPFQVVLSRLVSGPRIAAERVSALEPGAEPLDAEIVAESESEPVTPAPRSKGPVRRTRTSRKTAG